MMLMLNIFITVWCGRGSFALLRSTGTKPWSTGAFPGLDILNSPRSTNTPYMYYKHITKAVTTKPKEWLVVLKGWEPRACCRFCLPTFSSECPDLPEAWWSANCPRIARNYKLLKWALLLLPVKQLVSSHSKWAVQTGAEQGSAGLQGPGRAPTKQPRRSLQRGK